MLNAQSFCAQAKPVQVVIAGQPFVAQPKAFRTGSYGWFLTGNLNTTVGGEVIKVQIGLNLTVVGSKAKAPTPLP